LRRLDIAIGPARYLFFVSSRTTLSHSFPELGINRWTLLCIFPFLLGHPFSFGFFHRSTVAFMLKFIGETREIPLFVSSSISLYIFYLCSPLPSCLSLVTVLVLHPPITTSVLLPPTCCLFYHTSCLVFGIYRYPPNGTLSPPRYFMVSLDQASPFLTLLWVHSRSLRLGYNTMLLISCQKFSGVTTPQHQAPVPQT